MSQVVANLGELPTESAVAAFLADRASEGTIHQVDNRPLLLTPTGLNLIDLERYHHLPHRKRGTTTLHSKDALLRYLEQAVGEEESPAIFANYANMSFTLIGDFFSTDKAAWLDHRAICTLELTPQYKEWVKNQKQWLPQSEFAVLLDQRLEDITSPPQAEILTLVENFEASATSTVRSGTKIQSGEIQLTYNHEHDPNKTTKVPSHFQIQVPIWRYGECIALTAKLYYRVNDGKVKFMYLIDKLDRVLEKLWAEEMDTVRTAMKPGTILYEGEAPKALTA